MIKKIKLWLQDCLIELLEKYIAANKFMNKESCDV